MTIFSRIIYFPKSSVKGIRNLICVSAQRVFFRLALFYIIFLQTTEADCWGDFIQSVLNALACVAGVRRLRLLKAARGEHANGREVLPLILFKGKEWLHTDHILEIPPHPLPPFVVLSWPSNFAIRSQPLLRESKVHGCLKEFWRGLWSLSVLSRPLVLKNLWQFKFLWGDSCFENLYNTKSRLYGIQATRNYDALLFALVDRSVSFLVRFLPLFCIEKCYWIKKGIALKIPLLFWACSLVNGRRKGPNWLFFRFSGDHHWL